MRTTMDRVLGSEITVPRSMTAGYTFSPAFGVLTTEHRAPGTQVESAKQYTRPPSSLR